MAITSIKGTIGYGTDIQTGASSSGEDKAKKEAELKARDDAARKSSTSTSTSTSTKTKTSAEPAKKKTVDPAAAKSRAKKIKAAVAKRSDKGNKGKKGILKKKMKY